MRVRYDNHLIQIGLWQRNGVYGIWILTRFSFASIAETVTDISMQEVLQWPHIRSMVETMNHVRNRKMMSN